MFLIQTALHRCVLTKVQMCVTGSEADGRYLLLTFLLLLLTFLSFVTGTYSCSPAVSRAHADTLG